MRLLATGVAVSLTAFCGAQTLAFYAQGPGSNASPNFVRESAAGYYAIGGLQRFSGTGQPLYSQPHHSQSNPLDVCPLANGDYASVGGDYLVLRRPDGAIKWQVDLTSNLTIKVIEADGDLIVLITNLGVATFATRVDRHGAVVWTKPLAPIYVQSLFQDHNFTLFEASSDSVYIGGIRKTGITTTGYTLQRLRLVDGTVASQVDSNLASDLTRFARTGDRIAVIQSRGSAVDIAAYNAGVLGAMPEVWRISAPDPYPGATSGYMPALCSAQGFGFLYSYQDKQDEMTPAKQVVQELDLNGAPRFTQIVDSPNPNEDLGYRALITDGTYAYATGSIKSKSGPILYDRLLLSVWRRSDGEEVGWYEQGHHSPLLSGTDLCVNYDGAIGVALSQNTTKNPRYKLAKFFFAPPIGVTGVAVGRSVIAGQNRTIGTVTLDRPVILGGVDVQLSSTAPEVMVPSTLTVPAGSGTKTFTVSTSREPGDGCDHHRSNGQLHGDDDNHDSAPRPKRIRLHTIPRKRR